MGGNGPKSNSSALASTGSDITRYMCVESYSLNAEGCVRRTRVGGEGRHAAWAARVCITAITHAPLFGYRSKKKKVIFRTICFYSQAMKAALSLALLSGSALLGEYGD
jgi:hypothetical protein